MTTIETLATYKQPHRHHRAGEVIESFDCGIAPLESDDVVEQVHSDMSALGRDLFEFAVGLSRAQAKGEL